MPKLINEHKTLSYSYLVWVLIHVSLFLFSKPRGRNTDPHVIRHHGKFYDLSDGFYPFRESLSDLFYYGEEPHLSLVGNINRYDVSELFFYTILVPVVAFGIIKYIPYSSLIKKLKGYYQKLRNSSAKKKDKHKGQTVAHELKEDEESVIVPIQARPTTKGVASIEKTEHKEENDKNTINDNGIEVHPREEQSQEEMPNTGLEPEAKKMPLLSRFAGSLIDKIIIVIVFVIASISISWYGAPSRLGIYVGLRDTPLYLYEYLDTARMNSYGTYKEGITKGYQDMARLENGPPYIGMTLDIDKSVTFSFIIFNLIYYILFESILSASLGKRIFGGIILYKDGEKCDLERIVIRGICGGALMAGTYYLLHLVGGLTNSVVVIVFFLLLDLPLLFTKRSLIDIWTGTKYAKR